MKWVIRSISEGMYMASPRLRVFSSLFARRFSSKKQAEAYILASGLDRKKYIAEELHIESDFIDDKTLKH